jgi:glyoxylase-like metal-dependent hydrolase (beta-lactamase superfamily II)
MAMTPTTVPGYAPTMGQRGLPAGLHEIRLLRVKAHAVIDGSGITLIDSGHAGSVPAIERALARLGASIADVRRLICTHGHPDHAGSARALADRGIEVFIHPADAENLEVGFGDVVRHPSRGRIFAAMTPPLPGFTPLVDGDVLPVLGGLRAIHTPGHTPGSVCLFAPRDGVLFVGDTLQRRFGRVSFASALYSDDPALARDSVQRLASLDVRTIVFSHFPPLREGAMETLAGLAAQVRPGPS